MFAARGSMQVSPARKAWRDLKYRWRVWKERRSVPRSALSLYSVKAGYHHRLNNSYFDDFHFNDAAFLEEAQREVYERALQDARDMSARLVVDVGCGAGTKLVRYFSGFETIGFDVPETVAKLRQTYPDRDWRSVPFGEAVDVKPDIVICADVIEHIPDPDQLVAFLKRFGASRYYISTPERLTFYGKDQDGPPTNQAHCREWSLDELSAYLGQHFVIKEHFISNARDHTQLAICELPAA